METAQEICPKCNSPISADLYFCPNCGNQLKAKDITVSITTQILVYLLSFFLAPLGLYPAIKYLRQPNPKTKIVGVIALGLTIISLVITMSIANSFLQKYGQMLNGLDSGQVTGY